MLPSCDIVDPVSDNPGRSEVRYGFEEDKPRKQESLDMEHQDQQCSFQRRHDRIRPQDRSIGGQESCHAAEDNPEPRSSRC
jgi:hypothetical protein